MTGKNLKKKKPPKQQIKSLQLDLFSAFVTNDLAEVSNTVEIWESIPKYFFTPHQIKKLRTQDGLASSYKWEFEHGGSPCIVRISPALIEQSDGKDMAFFPSSTEELVEEALKKILSEQQYGFHDPQQAETWVRFTLRMIQKELKARGRDRNIAQIKHAIEVMSGCMLSYFIEGKEVWKGSILQDLVTVNREDFTGDREAHHIARLPLFISKSINSLEYRQFNYDRLMSCDEQLSRWIYKRFIHRFKQASMMKDYHFMYSDVKHSGLLQQTRERDNRRKMISALNELKDRGVLTRFEFEERKKGRAISDVKYSVWPSLEFTREQTAANKRAKDHLVTAKHGRLPLVDKS